MSNEINLSQFNTKNTEKGCNLKKGGTKTKVTDHSQKLTARIKTMKEDNQHILGIGPTHWMGEGPFRIVDDANGTNYLVVHCGSSDTAYRGVAIVVSSELQPAVTSCDFVSCRIVSVDLNAQLQLHGEQFQGTVVEVYVPRKKNDKSEHDTFRKDLERLVDRKLGQSRWILLMGSANNPAKKFKEILDNYSAKEICPGEKSTGGTSTVCTFRALIFPNKKKIDCLNDKTKVCIRSADCCQVQTDFNYKLSGGEIHWSQEAKENNQPSRVNTVQSQQRVVAETQPSARAADEQRPTPATPGEPLDNVSPGAGSEGSSGTSQHSFLRETAVGGDPRQAAGSARQPLLVADFCGETSAAKVHRGDSAAPRPNSRPKPESLSIGQWIVGNARILDSLIAQGQLDLDGVRQYLQYNVLIGEMVEAGTSHIMQFDEASRRKQHSGLQDWASLSLDARHLIAQQKEQ